MWVWIAVLISALLFITSCEDKIESAKTPEEKLKALVEKHFEVEKVEVNKAVNGKYIVLAWTEPKDSIVSGSSEWMLIMNGVGDLLNDALKYKLSDQIDTIKLNLQYISSRGNKYTPAMVYIETFPSEEIPFGAYPIIADTVRLDIPNIQFRNWFCDFAEDKNVSPSNPRLMEWCYMRAQCKKIKDQVGSAPPQCKSYLID